VGAGVLLSAQTFLLGTTIPSVAGGMLLVAITALMHALFVFYLRALSVAVASKTPEIF
jgi:hypothetical protein